MSDDTTDADRVITASGGISSPVRDLFPFVTANRGPIEFVRTDWTDPGIRELKTIPWRTRKAAEWRSRIGRWMVERGHKLDGSRCHDEDCW